MPRSGESDLDILLQRMSPVLDESCYVFVSLNGSYGDYAELEPLAAFREREGLTLILSEAMALKAGFPVEERFRRITLEVHSSLNAVGLTAAVSGRLTERGISANVVAAFYHDHVFVPADSAEEALQALMEFTG